MNWKRSIADVNNKLPYDTNDPFLAAVISRGLAVRVTMSACICGLMLTLCSHAYVHVSLPLHDTI